MKNSNTALLLGAIGLGVWYFFLRTPNRLGQRAYLQSWYMSLPGVNITEYNSFLVKLDSMSDAELLTVYHYIHDYLTKGKDLQQGSAIYNDLMVISDKYTIFTS